MKYLVTGGAGFIGSRLAQKLIDLGHEVVVIDNLLTGFLANVPKEAEFIQADCSDTMAIEALKQHTFDAIFHFAGQSSGEISFDDPVCDLNCNTTSTLRLLDYAVNTGCKRFLYASTMSVYGAHDQQPKVSEKSDTQPLSFYAVGKLASERYLQIYQQQYGIGFTALRLFNVYGPGQNMENLRQGMVSIFLKQMVDDQFDSVVVKGAFERFRDMIYIDDVIGIVVQLLNSPQAVGETFNVGTGVKTTVGQLLTVMQETIGSNKPIIQSEGTPGDQFGIYADITKLSNIISMSNTSLSQGLKNMYESFLCTGNAV